MVFILCGVGKEAYNNGLTVWAILRLMPYLLPTALLFGVPAALLFAVTTSFGRMSAGGEIIALKALGISPGVVLMPIGVLAVLLSLVTFWLNDIAFSWGEIGSRQVVVDAFEEIAYGVLRKKHSFSSQLFSVYVQKVEGRTLINATFKFQESADSPPMTLNAEEAELRSSPGTGVLTLFCRNCHVEIGRAILRIHRRLGTRDSVGRSIRRPLRQGERVESAAAGAAEADRRASRCRSIGWSKRSRRKSAGDWRAAISAGWGPKSASKRIG